VSDSVLAHLAAAEAALPALPEKKASMLSAFFSD
jgi:hypothetical protein